MNLLLMLIACGSENLILDSDAECETSDIANGAITYELSCPDIPACPTVNLTCPELIVPACPAIEVTCPEPIVTVTAPTVTVEPAEVNVTHDFADLVIAIDTLASSSGGGNTPETWAWVGYNSVPYSIWDNNTNMTAVLTTAAAASGCDIYDATGTLEIDDLCNSSRCSTSNWSPGVTGSFQVPIEPGGWIDCTSSNSSGVYLGGYYQ